MTLQPNINPNFFVGSLNKNRSIICSIVLFLLTLLFVAVLNQKTDIFDENILAWLQQFTNPFLTKIFKLFYLIGDEYFAALIVFINLIFLYLKRYRQEAKVFAGGALGILIIIDLILKPFFDRPRPLQRLASDIIGNSFPSGHVAGNFFLYFYLAYLLAKKWPDRSKSIYTITAIFILLISLSTVYLRLHWPTDVIASYGIGYLWLTTCLTTLKFLKKDRSK